MRDEIFFVHLLIHLLFFHSLFVGGSVGERERQKKRAKWLEIEHQVVNRLQGQESGKKWSPRSKFVAAPAAKTIPQSITYVRTYESLKPRILSLSILNDGCTEGEKLVGEGEEEDLTT